ncbi:MAG: thiamine diphosphokinase [Clostridia bacterium]|nr:thiamine diphosphokinase [Clostridia bacterium]
MKHCILVGGGNFCEKEFIRCREDFEVSQEEYAVVAVDSGYEYIKEISKVACIVGDFDSLGYVPDNIPIVKHDPVKDYTDMSLAIEYMKNQGYDSFVIFGGLGGRLDHTLANLQMAHGFFKGGSISITFIDSEHDVRFISDTYIIKDGKAGQTFSLFAFDKCSGVNVSGAKYNLKDHTLTNTFPLGVSNEFVGGECQISVKEGFLIYIQVKK